MSKISDFSNKDILIVKTSFLDEMKSIVDRNENKRCYRYCYHSSPDDKLHEMLMCQSDGEYVRPHKHDIITETNTIIKGKMLAVFFDDSGNIIESAILGNSLNEALSFRIKPGIYHMTIPLTEYVWFIETKLGPHKSTDNIWADWAPSEGDLIREYINVIKGQIIEN